MKYERKELKTKTGFTVELASAAEDEAAEEIEYLKRVCDETPFLLTEGCDVNYTVEGEREFLKNFEDSENCLMLNAYDKGRLIGNCSFFPAGNAKRMLHRASLGIAIFKEYCNCGIGELMLRELLDCARKCGYEIMELDVYAENVRAIHLYEKLGFIQRGRLVNAVKYKDGTYDDLILMQKPM